MKSIQQEIVKLLPLRGGEKILDIGCGKGKLAIELKSTYPKATVTGIDPDKKALNNAKRNAEKKNLAIEFIQTGAEKLPFSADSFDIIVCSLVFHHMPTDIKKLALKEIYRVLKPNGKFLLVDVGKPKNQLWKIFFKIAVLFESKLYPKENLEGKLFSFMEDAGFSVHEAREPYFGIQFLLGIKT